MGLLVSIPKEKSSMSLRSTSRLGIIPSARSSPVKLIFAFIKLSRLSIVKGSRAYLKRFL